MAEGYVSHLVLVQHLVRPHIRHVCVLLPLVRPHERHAYLGLYIAASLKGRTTCIWPLGYGFACATAMGYTGFKLLFVTIIVL